MEPKRAPVREAVCAAKARPPQAEEGCTGLRAAMAAAARRPKHPEVQARGRCVWAGVCTWVGGLGGAEDPHECTSRRKGMARPNPSIGAELSRPGLRLRRVAGRGLARRAAKVGGVARGMTATRALASYAVRVPARRDMYPHVTQLLTSPVLFLILYASSPLSLGIPASACPPMPSIGCGRGRGHELRMLAMASVSMLARQL